MFSKLTALIIVLSLISACNSEDIVERLEPFDSVYWNLKVNYPAVLLSDDSTQRLQLTAIPYNAKGEVILAEDSLGIYDTRIVWSSSDSSKVRVSATGIITPLGLTDGVTINVSMTFGRVTHTAQSRIAVRDKGEYQEILSFSIFPDDSLKRGVSFMPYIFPVKAYDKDGNQMQSFPVYWETSNRKRANIIDQLSGIIEMIGGDSVTIRASGWVYDRFVEDSFVLQIGAWIGFPFPATEVRQVSTRDGSIIFVEAARKNIIGSGGSVLFKNTSGFGPLNMAGVTPLNGKEIDIIFDDPTVALGGGAYPGDVSGSGGNILGLSSDTTQHFTAGQATRRFIKLGEHSYTIQPFGYRGVVSVKP